MITKLTLYGSAFKYEPNDTKFTNYLTNYLVVCVFYKKKRSITFCTSTGDDMKIKQVAEN